jgi:hypothetical protein
MALENNAARSTNIMKDEVIHEWVLKKYPSLKDEVFQWVLKKCPSLKLNDSPTIKELKDVIDKIIKKEADTDILDKHAEIINIPVTYDTANSEKEASSEKDVLDYIKSKVSIFTNHPPIRRGGKRSRRARKSKKAKRSKKANKRGTRRS